MMSWWLLLGAMPLDTVGAPLPLYLSTSQVMTALRDVEPALQACGVGGNHTIGIHLELQGEGRAAGTLLEREQETLAESDAQCWMDAVHGHLFPKHHGVPVVIETTIYVRDGVTSLSPQPTIFEREHGVLLLFVQPGPAHEESVKVLLNGAKVVEE